MTGSTSPAPAAAAALLAALALTILAYRTIIMHSDPAARVRAQLVPCPVARRFRARGRFHADRQGPGLPSIGTKQWREAAMNTRAALVAGMPPGLLPPQ